MRMISGAQRRVSVVDPGTGLRHVIRLSQNPTIFELSGHAILPYNWLFVGIKNAYLLRTPDGEDE